MKSIYHRLLAKETKIAIIGLGYVGLPVALSFARKLSVIGFDTNKERVSLMQQGIDPSNELGGEAFANTDVIFTSQPEDLALASFFIVAVPTPVDEHSVPDITALKKASRQLGAIVKAGDCVVFESTVYPGCTEEDCVPLIESVSGLKAGVDFSYGYSPERINPGDKVHTLSNVIKVVSGNDESSLEEIATVYELIIEAGVHRAPSVKVAEAAKIIENTQRAINIALMNELSIIFDKMDINTYDVLDAAGTKWNFLKFFPGLVGGHCIGVDPYYLTYKSRQLGYDSRIILAGHDINDEMAVYLAKKTVQSIIRKGINIATSKVLVMGCTFKENITDIRNSKVAEVVRELRDYNVTVHVVDPLADSNALQQEYGFGLKEEVEANYDAVMVAVPHKQYAALDEQYFKSIMREGAVLVDVRGLYRNKIQELDYWSF